MFVPDPKRITLQIYIHDLKNKMFHYTLYSANGPSLEIT
jgi:hypothetical protein